MAKRIHSSEGAPGVIGPYSQAAEAAGLVFVSGQLGIDPSTGAIVPGGIKEETKRALENLGAILKAAGLGFGDVLKTTAFLKEIADFGAFNEVYASYFKADPPARSAFQVVALPKNGSVEIEAIAVAAIATKK